MQRPDLVEDPLYLACTRPALFGGVPIVGVVAAVGLPFLAFLITAFLPMLIFILPLFFGLQQIVRNDYNRLQVLFVGLRTRFACRTRRHWGGSTRSPLRGWRHYDQRDLL
ncbi:MAG: type IV secretion system protein VirB3 [Inquilinus sp.]|uniref:type IV secretion system protein VirB3 n=1 Tax=Inquilinus sp. TaxID=1932117 RepID=UPI003F2B0AC9